MWFMKRKIRKNRRNFYIGACCCSIIFLIGLLYILVPAIYGFDTMELINTNSLFICTMLVFATMGFGEFILIGNEVNNDAIFQSIGCAVCGIINLLLSELTTANTRLVICLGIYLVIYSLIKCFYIEALHNKKDVMQYIEICLTVPYVVVGIALACTFAGGNVIKTVALGFLMILQAVLKCVGLSFRTMLKSKRFLNKLNK